MKVGRGIQGNHNAIRNLLCAFGIFVIAFLLLACRRPDILFRAQFWAEDGNIWYAEAYKLGFWHALLMTHTGYFQTIARLVVGSSIYIPIAYAPFYSNCIALIIRALIACFFLSRRFDYIACTPRIIIALYYCIMPDIDELHANMTNTYWYMALYALLIFIARPAQKKWEWVHDCVVIFISSVSGLPPVFLIPFIGLKYICETEREKWFDWVRLRKFLLNPVYIALCFGALIQVSHLEIGGRSGSTLGATLTRFMQIISSRFLVGITGNHVADWPWQSAIFAYIITLILACVLIGVVCSKNWKLITVMIFPLIVIAVALYKPVISSENEQWKYLRIMGAAQRYFFLYHICIFGAIVVVLYSKCRTAVAQQFYQILFAVWFGALAVRYYHIPPIPDQHWVEAVNKFHQASRGKKVDMATAPKGWTMTLIKK